MHPSLRRSRSMPSQSTARIQTSGQTRLRLKGDAVVDHSCRSGKVCYPSRILAERAAEHMMTLGHVDPGCHQTDTDCSECRYWHVFNRKIVFPDD